MISKPDVSVIVAAWKAAGFIENAVRSALASADVAIEIVVVDDASPDDTWLILQGLAASDPRIILDRLVANSGPSAARNRAIALSTGRFVAVLDADDTIAADRLARLVTVADQTGADIVVDNMLEVSETGEPLGPFLKSAAFSVACDITLETWIDFNEPLKPGDCLGYLKPLIRRTTLDRLAAPYDTSLRNSEDYYLVANLLAAGARMTYTPETGYRYTRSAGSTSHRLKPDQTKAWLAAERAFALAHSLSPAQRTRVERRARALRNVDHMVAATHALKTRRLGAFAKLLASDITGSAYTLRSFAGVALARLRERSTVKNGPAA